jgi:predicted DNA-binding transcriptional regulator AlpA
MMETTKLGELSQTTNIDLRDPPAQIHSQQDLKHFLFGLPRGLSRRQAASYIGIGTTLFDELIKERKLPSPKHLHSRKLWDRFELDSAFESLSCEDEINPWDVEED